jgi:uncharacterized protein (TIGR04255 family)
MMSQRQDDVKASLPSNDGLKFDNPPVRLVMLNLWFKPLKKLQTLDLAVLRTMWRDAFPQIHEMSPLPRWDSTSSDVTFLTEEGGWPMPACLFMNFKGDREILIQQDRLVLTWRFSEERSEYPGFKFLLAQMDQYYRDFIGAVEEAGINRPRVERVALQYVNEIEGVDHQDAVEALVLERSIELSRNSRSVNSVYLAKHFCGTPENEDVTVQMTVLEGQRVDAESSDEDRNDDDHGTLITTMRVEGHADVESGGNAPDRLAAVHDAVIERFAEFVGPSLRKLWGGRDEH